jgi:hypothetical protein
MPSPIKTDLARAGLSRRALVRSSSVGAVGLAAGVIVTGKTTLADPARYNADAIAAQISNKLFADDGLARPAPDKPTVSELARGLDRTLVLGGGGEYYVAWYCGFLHGLYEQKVDLNIAEMVVGNLRGCLCRVHADIGAFQALAECVRLLWPIPGPVRQAGTGHQPHPQPETRSRDQFQCQGWHLGVHSCHRPRCLGSG